MKIHVKAKLPEIIAEEDDTAMRQKEDAQEDEDAFFEELDQDMIDEGVTTQITTK